jgi:integrase
LETLIQDTQTKTHSKNESAIIDFIWQLKKDGYHERTILNYSKFLGMLVKHGADLFDGESVKAIVATHQSWSKSTKATIIAAYRKFALYNKIVWTPPKYKAVKKVPFIPLESEIDCLIATCGKKIAAVLQLLKETGMRIGEALGLEWTDIDFENNIITLNNPEKNGVARQFRISNKLCMMINRQKKDPKFVFGNGSKHSVICNFRHQRKKLVQKTGNLRFGQIHFHTIRHWKATTEYHNTKDILHVMEMLGHRSINNTLMYTHLLTTKKSDAYYSATAKTVEEAQKLVESGFEYVTEIDAVKLFRKRK